MQQCLRQLQDIGFVEEAKQLYCEGCFETFLAPTCARCSKTVKGVRYQSNSIVKYFTEFSLYYFFFVINLLAGLFERHRQAISPGMLCVHLLWSPLWQQPFLPGGWPALLRSWSLSLLINFIIIVDLLFDLIYLFSKRHRLE